jgi:hypothetical protein
MAASDYVPIFFKNRLHLAGRPQMSTRLFETGGLSGRAVRASLRGRGAHIDSPVAAGRRHPTLCRTRLYLWTRQPHLSLSAKDITV